MIIRPYRPEDRAAVIDVLRASFGGWQGGRSDQYFDWKFVRNPHGHARIWVGDDDGRVAGCYIWNPVRLRVGVATIAGAQSVDAAVHPDYQGRGLFTDLAKEATQNADGFHLVYAFPTEAAYRGQLRVGFESLFPVPKVHRPLPPAPWRRARSGGLVVRDVQEFDQRFDVFRDRGQGRNIAIERDAEYLRWRYSENPVRQYETIACERDGELCGFCVLYVDAGRSLRPGYVVDLRVLSGFVDVADFLLLHSLQRLHSLGSRVAVAWERPEGPEQEALNRLGFSARYDALRRRLKRPGYVSQVIAYEADPDALRLFVDEAGMPPWSLVPGDADYM